MQKKELETLVFKTIADHKDGVSPETLLEILKETKKNITLGTVYTAIVTLERRGVIESKNDGGETLHLTDAGAKELAPPCMFCDRKVYKEAALQMHQRFSDENDQLLKEIVKTLCRNCIPVVIDIINAANQRGIIAQIVEGGGIVTAKKKIITPDEDRMAQAANVLPFPERKPN